MSSKKDYVAVAEQFARIRSKALTHREKTMLTELASCMASVFRKHNPNFNTDRFLQAAHAYEEQEQP